MTKPDRHLRGAEWLHSLAPSDAASLCSKESSPKRAAPPRRGSNYRHSFINERMVLITHSQRLYRLVSPQAAALPQSRFSVQCPVIVFFFSLKFKKEKRNTIACKWNAALTRCSSMLKPRLCQSAAWQSCRCSRRWQWLMFRGFKHKRFSLRLGWKYQNREELSSGDGRRKSPRERRSYSAPVTFKNSWPDRTNF